MDLTTVDESAANTKHTRIATHKRVNMVSKLFVSTWSNKYGDLLLVCSIGYVRELKALILGCLPLILW